MLALWDLVLLGLVQIGWYVKYLAIPPPAVRPSVKHDAQQRSEDDISHIIVNIIKANKTLQEKLNKILLQRSSKTGPQCCNIIALPWLIIVFLV